MKIDQVKADEDYIGRSIRRRKGEQWIKRMNKQDAKNKKIRKKYEEQQIEFVP
jgi:hypothetical protein